MAVHELGDARVLVCGADDPAVDSEAAVRELIGWAWGERATVIAVPVARLDPSFFRLRSGLAGAITQLCVNYHLQFAVIGDITDYLAASNALRDWVRECARGGEVLFVPDLDALAARLAVESAR